MITNKTNKSLSTFVPNTSSDQLLDIKPASSIFSTFLDLNCIVLRFSLQRKEDGINVKLVI